MVEEKHDRRDCAGDDWCEEDYRPVRGLGQLLVVFWHAKCYNTLKRDGDADGKIG